MLGQQAYGDFFMRSQTTGFTLIELMVTVTIIAILAAVALPTYVNYTRRAHFTEIVSATSPYKVGVLECYQTTATLTGCDGGQNKIPPNVTSPQGAVSSITVSNGVITAEPVAENGISASDTYILTPTVINTTLIWAPSGGSVSDGYAS
jgi:type IV pilus assembly protein PilA